MAEGTLRNIPFQFKYLKKNVDIDNPSEVEAFIANKRCANSYKANLIKAYNYYAIANVYNGLDPHTNGKANCLKYPQPLNKNQH